MSGPETNEGYQPSPKEIQEAENSMSDHQYVMSVERERIIGNPIENDENNDVRELVGDEKDYQKLLEFYKIFLSKEDPEDLKKHSQLRSHRWYGKVSQTMEEFLADIKENKVQSLRVMMCYNDDPGEVGEIVGRELTPLYRPRLSIGGSSHVLVLDTELTNSSVYRVSSPEIRSGDQNRGMNTILMGRVLKDATINMHKHTLKGIQTYLQKIGAW